MMTDRFDLAGGQAGLGFVAVAAGMVVGRFGGDLVTTGSGSSGTRRGGALLAAIGVLIATTAPSPAVAGVGLFVAGLGLSVLFPLHVPRPPSEMTHGSTRGMAAFSSGARLGFLVASPLMGCSPSARRSPSPLLIVAAAGGRRVARRRLPAPRGAERRSRRRPP